MNIENLPPNWRSATIADVGAAQLGHQLTPDSLPSRRRVPYIRAANIGDGELILDDVRYMSLHDDEVPQFRLSAGDVVVSEASGSSAQVGKAAVWDGSIPECCIQNTVIRLRCGHGIGAQYVADYLRYARIAGIIAAASRGVGILHLGLQGFSRLPIPVPPTAEQQRIVRSLLQIRQKLSDARMRSAAATAILSDQLDASLAAMLDEPGKSAELAAIAKLINGRAFKSGEWSKDEGLPIIRIQNLWAGQSSYNYFAGEVEDRHVVEPGDLLFAWSGTPGTSFGPHVWIGPRGALNQHIFKVTICTDDVSRDFLYWWLRASTSRLIAKARGGAGLQHLRKNDLTSLRVVIPSPERQATLVAKFVRLEQALALGRAAEIKIFAEAQSLEIAAAGRAFSGKLGTTNPSEDKIDLVAPAKRTATRKKVRRVTAPAYANLRDAMLDALRSSTTPLAPPEWFSSTKERFDVGAIDFNQMLVDLIHEKSVNPVRSANIVKYGMAS